MVIVFCQARLVCFLTLCAAHAQSHEAWSGNKKTIYYCGVESLAFALSALRALITCCHKHLVLPQCLGPAPWLNIKSCSFTPWKSLMETHHCQVVCASLTLAEIPEHCCHRSTFWVTAETNFMVVPNWDMRELKNMYEFLRVNRGGKCMQTDQLAVL